MVNPKSLANLKPFQKGNTTACKDGKRPSLTAALQRYARNHPKELDELAAAMYLQAREVPAYAREILERLDGKVAQPVSGELTLNHNVSFEVGKGYTGDKT